MSRVTPTIDRRQFLRLFGAVAAVGATGALAACSSDTATDGVQRSGLTIRIGLVAPGSGRYEMVGVDLRRGFQLFLDSRDNLLGPHNVDLRIVDEGETVESAVAAVAQLLDQGVVAVAGVANPDALPEISQLVQQRRVPLVNAYTAPGTLVNALYVWRVGSVLGDAGRSLAEYAHQQLGNRAYLIYEDTTVGREEADRFVTYFEDRDGIIINRQPGFTLPGSVEAQLTDAAARGADAIFVCHAGDAALAVLRAHRDLGITIPLLGPGSLTETIDLSSIGAFSANFTAYTSAFYAADLDNDANRRFVTGYHRQHGVQPTTAALAAYDAAAVLSRALSLVPGDPSGLAVNDAFSRLGQIESPRGTWTFNINRSPQQKWYLRRLALDGRVPANLLEADLTILG